MDDNGDAVEFERTEAIFVDSTEASARETAQALAGYFRAYSRGAEHRFTAYFVIGNEVHDKQRTYLLEILGASPEVSADVDHRQLRPVHREDDTVLLCFSNVYHDGRPYDVNYIAMRTADVPLDIDYSHLPVFESC